MSAKALQAFFTSRKNDAAGLVLASVYDTRGSTYSKTGARMLITGDGDFQGMLSGGCLEGDLAERAREVVTSGELQRVTYDLRQDDEELWGLGVGCEGLMRIVLQPLSADNHYQPFSDIMAVLNGDCAGVAATIIESEARGATVGTTLVGTQLPLPRSDLPVAVQSAIETAAARVLSELQSSACVVDADGDAVHVLFAVLRPSPTVLVLGAGLDAQPVVNLCAELGWRVTIQDHRPAYIDKGNFSGAVKVLCVPADTLADVIDLHTFDAAVVMSHHLVTDRTYLELLAATGIPYVGLLGPHDRRNRLLADLGELSARLEGRLHGPAGLDIGGRGPTSIALSIVAQMHQVLEQGSRTAGRRG